LSLSLRKEDESFSALRTSGFTDVGAGESFMAKSGKDLSSPVRVVKQDDWTDRTVLSCACVLHYCQVKPSEMAEAELGDRGTDTRLVSLLRG
jgi:hypothetical protein